MNGKKRDEKRQKEVYSKNILVKLGRRRWTDLCAVPSGFFRSGTVPNSGCDNANSSKSETSSENSTSGLQSRTNSPLELATSEFIALLRPTFLGEKLMLNFSPGRFS